MRFELHVVFGEYQNFALALTNAFVARFHQRAVFGGNQPDVPVGKLGAVFIDDFFYVGMAGGVDKNKFECFRIEVLNADAGQETFQMFRRTGNGNDKGKFDFSVLHNFFFAQTLSNCFQR